MIKKSAQIIHSINLSYSHKHLNIRVKHTNTVILRKLYALNLIEGFYKTDLNFVIKTNTNKGTNIFLKNFCRTGSKIYFTKNQLLKNKNHFFSTVYILSTPKGVLTQYEAIEKNTGGFLMVKIFLK